MATCGCDAGYRLGYRVPGPRESRGSAPVVEGNQAGDLVAAARVTLRHRPARSLQSPRGLRMNRAEGAGSAVTVDRSSRPTSSRGAESVVQITAVSVMASGRLHEQPCRDQTVQAERTAKSGD